MTRTYLPQSHDPEGEFSPLIELASGTLRDDMRDIILAWFKAQPKAWPFLPETEQRHLANAIDSFSAQVIKQACEIIAANERPCIVAKLVEYKEKDGLEAKLKLAGKAENVIELHNACGREVLIVTSGADEFTERHSDPDIDADQPDFPNLGSEYDNQ
ncbi:MAG: hypothetical protein LBV50_11390 [Novosphingobium sp.]|jgi:hypothetical protein|nr:hypothetical protein [Novosphingobium sp.]